MRKLLILSLVFALCCLPLQALAASTAAPVLTPDLRWSVVASSDDLVTVETTIYGGTLYVGPFTGNVREYLGGSAYDVPYSANNLNNITLDLGGLASYPGLYAASNVAVSISCAPVITLRSNGASFVLSDPTATGEVMWGYGTTSGFYFEDPYTELSLTGSVSDLVASWSPQSGRNWVASYVTWQWSFSAPADTPVGVDSFDVLCPVVVRLTGAPEVMRPYVTGSVAGDAIWDGLDVDNTLSNYAPSLDLLIDIDGAGTDFVRSVLTAVRRIPWVQSALIFCCTWAVIGLVLWRK